MNTNTQNPTTTEMIGLGLAAITVIVLAGLLLCLSVIGLFLHSNAALLGAVTLAIILLGLVAFTRLAKRG